MSDELIPTAIFFADVEGSTSTYERLGDAEAHRLMAQSLKMIMDAVVENSGTVIKTIGDEVMAKFSTASCAVGAARAIQLNIADGGADTPRVKVGLHFGPVIHQDGDVFGDVVNTAARVVGLSKGGQILTTQQAVDELSPEERKETRKLLQLLVKGKKVELEIYEVIWEKKAEYTVMFKIPDSGVSETRETLRLEFDGKTIELGKGQASLTIGRVDTNDVAISSPGVSRSHAKIEDRQGKFFLTDQSTNGTVVRLGDRAPLLLRREEVLLLGSGEIGVDADADFDQPFPIRFSISDSSASAS